MEAAKPPGRNFAGPWPRTPGRVFGVAMVRLYQLTLSGFIGNSCRFVPTCSEYAYEAIARHGLLIGVRFGAGRLAKCGPWKRTEGCSHTHDPVPLQLD